MNSPINTVFYRIEKCIKVYRRFAQRNISAIGEKLTLDQVIALKIIMDNSHISQKELADLMFKDVASISKIIQNLNTKKMLERHFYVSDRRRYSLVLTASAENLIKKIFQVVKENRKIALKGISIDELSAMQSTLQKIIDNCLNSTNHK